MTAIARIEKPNTCCDCPFCYDDIYCCVDNSIEMEGRYDERVNFACPLIDEAESDNEH